MDGIGIVVGSVGGIIVGVVVVGVSGAGVVRGIVIGRVEVVGRRGDGIGG